MLKHDSHNLLIAADQNKISNSLFVEVLYPRQHNIQ